MTRELVLDAVRRALQAVPALPLPEGAWELPREAMPDAVARFVQELDLVGGEAVRTTRAALAEAVRQVLGDAGLRHVFLAPDLGGDAFGLQSVTADEAWRRPEAVAGVARATWGIAETGTVVVAADGAHAPSLFTSLSIVLLDVDRVMDALEDVPPPGPAERARILVTGPSRTSDIEKRLVLGAHGPRRLVVLLVAP